MAQKRGVQPRQHQHVGMKQAEQVPWVNSYAEGQLRVTQFAVRFLVAVIGWLNTERITNIVYGFVTQVLDPALAALTGSYVRVGRENIPVTFINNVDPAFGVPLAPVMHQGPKGKVSLYEPKSFPFDSDDYDKNGLHEWVAHFLCLAIKVSYEDPIVVKHVVTNLWGWKYLGHFKTKQAKGQKLATSVRQERNDREKWNQRSNEQNKTKKQEIYSAEVAAKLIPDTDAFLMTNDNAVVLFFRGTEPSKLIEWASDGEIDLCKENGVIHGQVHGGWYEALLYPLLDPKHSIFQEICEALVNALKNNKKKLYITGHSMGGALTSVCAHVLASLSEEAEKQFPTVKKPDDIKIEVQGVKKLYSRIGAVYTFAGPLAGDRGFAEFMEEMYGGDKPPKMFRISHSSDIVPKVPPTILGYRHHPLEYFMSFDGFMYNEPQDIELWKFVEIATFSRIYWAKLRYDWGVYSPDGENVFGLNKGWVKFRRQAWHTFLRIFFYTGGFGLLILIRGILCFVPDHFPCDYEQKLRVMAKELYKYKNTPDTDKPSLTTHLLSRTHDDDATVDPNKLNEE